MINPVLYGGTRYRQEDSKWVVTYWHIPNGSDYQNAEARVIFFNNIDHAQDFAQKYSFAPEMAYIMDLSDPSIDQIFPRFLCRHCKRSVVDANGRWVHGDDVLSQYCWVDPVAGSQLHEV